MCQLTADFPHAAVPGAVWAVFLGARLAEATQQWQAAGQRADVLTGELSVLQSGLHEIQALKTEAEARCAELQKQIDAGMRLISCLRSEASLWSEKLSSLQSASVCMLGNCLLAAAYTIYGCDLPLKFRRQQCVDTWMPYLRVWDVPISGVRLPACVGCGLCGSLSSC